MSMHPPKRGPGDPPTKQESTRIESNTPKHDGETPATGGHGGGVARQEFWNQFWRNTIATSLITLVLILLTLAFIWLTNLGT